ncbi:hypothetical protein L249_5909 [Ophiocordyceps polyrhachis-furcata BCC 54312]|uniref:Uncharacterized protein n=1 Tax=Ophiocordyceps polyrhachis-furcata BCC 54312 TaxID=1330021 RepID=A0A367KZR0_9HYPO|nr:hypothetical protein L249_5909 [Ophiocordyceps polyrhachis-furcata BCC 54312]
MSASYKPSIALAVSEGNSFGIIEQGPDPGPSTRPEGLGGSRDVGPAVAGPRPPYVTEAERHNNVGGGYAVQRLRPYGPYGPYEGRNVGLGTGI